MVNDDFKLLRIRNIQRYCTNASKNILL